MAIDHTAATTPEHSYVEVYMGVRDEVAWLHGWSHTSDEMWCYVDPPGHLAQPQGWKIHLSATPRSAVGVLTAAARVLVRHRVPFKFAKSLTQLRLLLSIRCGRSAGGKFMTVYPDDAAQFRELLDELHQATAGLEGPAILSDRRYQSGSLVHYRYGGFSGGNQPLDSDGSFVPMLVAPSGWESDQRRAWFAPPAWAPPALPYPEPVRSDAERGTAKVMLDGRFVVHEAIRHSNRGGVYRAWDEQAGNRVIIKEARPYVAAELDGCDARDFLRNEYETLCVLDPLRVAVGPVSLFEYQGHTFLAEEELPGTTLREWVTDVVTASPERVVPLDRALPIAQQLVTLMAAVHDKGLVFRDFTPNNVMITPDHDLMIIDTEFVAAPGQLVTRVMTMGYVAPEDLTGPAQYPAPPPSTDLYSLGASLFYLCGGTHPLLPRDEPPEEAGDEPAGEVRSHDQRLEFLVRAVADSNSTLRALAPVVTALMRYDPRQRPDLHRVQEMLSGCSTGQPAPGSTAPVRLSRRDQQRLLDDGRRQLVAAMAPDDPRHLWPETPLEGRVFDPLSLQAGAAGTLEVMRRGLLATGDDELRRALDTGLNWLDRRLTRDQRVLPGLYFGRGGTYWAMYEAAEALGNDAIMQRTVERAKHLPVKWSNPDITHGVAGGGLAQLHLWRRTGDDELRQRVLICVDSILAVRADHETIWPVTGSSLPSADGLTHYGFAHGVAGICAFLLAVSRELNRPDLLQVAVEGGELLLTLARPHGAGALWPVAQPEAEASARFDGVCWWCSGAPGVATFLIRLWRSTGESRYLDAAHRAAVATRAERWLLTASHCHGLAGNGEFLLDVAAATGQQRYRDWAEEHALALHRLCSIRDGRLVPLDDTSAGVSYSYNLGMAGPIGFLHRIRHGGERWWMVDDFTLPSGDQ